MAKIGVEADPRFSGLAVLESVSDEAGYVRRNLTLMRVHGTSQTCSRAFNEYQQVMI